MSPRPSLLAIVLTLGALAAAVVYTRLSITNSSSSTRFLPRLAAFTRTSSPISTASTATASSVRSNTFELSGTRNMSSGHGKGEVYFLSHGGPPTMFEVDSKPYKAWEKYGQMVEASSPRGLVVVSAHWENPSEIPGVVVNVDASNPLVYDFYGFPSHYYKQTFQSHGEPAMVDAVKAALVSAGVEVSTAKRGLDHGVWVPFKVAFNGSTDIPIVQVSLPGDSSPISSAKLGKALASLREQGYGIMGTGQAVHNLRDFMYGRSTAYAKPFLDAASAAVSSSKPLEGSLTLFRHPLYRNAHPTPEHLLPLVVAAGAVDPASDEFDEIFTSSDGALGWGMWRWKPKA